MELKPLLATSELLLLMQLLKNAKRVVVLGHSAPDGDAMGSSLGWAEYLRNIGKHVSIVMPNPAADFLRWLPGAQNVLFYTDEEHQSAARKAIAEADLICCLDFNQLSRLREDVSALVEKSKAKRIMVDHHLNPDSTGMAMVVSRPKASSASELVFRLINELGGYDRMTRSGACCIYCGMMCDTGSFTFNSADPEVYLIIAMLLAKGIDKDKIYRNVFHSFSANRLKFWGYMLHEKLKFYAGGRASIMTYNCEEMKRFKFIRGDAEGLVNQPLQVRGCRLSISLREDTDLDVIRVSLRSVDDVPCNQISAEFFNGGGHLNASGGELACTLEEAVKIAEQAIEKYRDCL